MASAKTFIVTGASKGIGLAVAKYLVAHSQNVVLTARSAAPMEELKKGNESKVEFIAGDITDSEIPVKLVDLAVRTFGKLDGMVVNHGTLTTKLTKDITVEEYRHDYDVNVFSYLAMVKAGLDQLRQSKGCILFTSSGAAVKEYRSWGSYGSSKAAVNSIAAHIAIDEPDIITLAIAPGRVDTEMQQVLRDGGGNAMEKKEYDRFVEEHKTGKLLKPEQPGNVIARFATNPSSQLSGKFVSWNSPDLADYQD